MADDEKASKETKKKRNLAIEKEKKKKKQEKVKQRLRKDLTTIRKGGNFQVQVHVIEARDLAGKDHGDISDPVVTVTIFDEKKCTKIMSKTKNPRWDQVLYFELDNLEPDELSHGKALIQVFDANRILRNELIGAFEFDLSWVYYREHHEAYNQWIALTNPAQNEKNKSKKTGNDGIEGYLKLSITVLGPLDEQHMHDEEAEAANELDFESGMVLISPGIIQTPYLLSIQIYEAKSLTKTDTDWLFSERKGDENLDPFFVVEFAGVRLESDIYQSVNPKCQVQFDIPLMEPLFSRSINISVMDHDTLIANDRIGSLKLDYLSLKREYKEMQMKPCWMYMYGAPHGHQTGYSKKMNKGLVEGSNFRGMIFMEASVKKMEKTNSKRQKVREQINAVKMPQMLEYCLRVDLYEGTEISKIVGENEMFVSIQVCDCQARSTSQRVTGEVAVLKWYEQLFCKDYKRKAIGPFWLPADWNTNPEPVILPDVFIYLCVKETKDKMEQVSYCRVPLNKIIMPAPSRPKAQGKKDMFECFEPGVAAKWDNEPKWFDMKSNLALDKYDENVFPGALLIGLNCGPVDDLTDEQYKLIQRPFATSRSKADDHDDDDDTKSDEPVHVVTPSGTHANITIHCVKAVNLPDSDFAWFGQTPSSDPYVEIVIHDSETKKDSETEEDSETKKERVQQTDHVDRNLSPKWDQKLVFNNVKIGSTMSLRVMDWDGPLLPDDELANLKNNQYTLDGVDMEQKWMALTPSKQALKKYKRKPDKLKGIKIKIGISYDWNVEEEEKRGLFSTIRKLKPKKARDAQTEDKIAEPERRAMRLRAHIYQAKNLENLDVFGLSDAYLVVRFCGKTAKTKVKEDQLDPKWYQTLTLTPDVPIPLKYAPRIYCEVFDHDDIGKDETLGRFEIPAVDCQIDLADSAYSGPTPKWYQLKNAHHQTIKGSVLCALELIDLDQSNKHKYEPIKPSKKQKQWINIHTLGLRDIQSTFGCYNPFIEFELNGIIYETEKSNRPNARNPNFCQILKFEVLLPTEDIFRPNLNLTIKDSLFGGMMQRKLGYASIGVAELMRPDNVKLLKITKDEDEENEIRKIVERQMADEEKKQQRYDEVPAAHHGDILLGVAQNTINNLLDQLQSQSDKANEEKRLKKLTDAQKKGDLIIYEWTKKTNLSSSKVRPVYLQNRQPFDDELEDIMSLKPFLKIPFIYGKNERTVGYFKGLISFPDEKQNSDVPDGNLKYLEEITNRTPLYLRLYVLQAFKLLPADDNGNSDPYLLIKTGKTRVSTRDSYVENTNNPDFYQSFEIPVTMPGDSKLTIEVWDWDGIGDDLIGRTEIDIEDRWYSKEWREMAIKPLETRTLWSEQSTVSQGKLSLWMELISPAEVKNNPMVDISPPDQLEYELRVIVWQCKDCTIMDEMTNMNDLFITGELISSVEEENAKQQTDLHFRSQNGYGSFNWRMKFPIMLPKRKLSEYPRLRIQIWDRDFFSPDDHIAEKCIELKRFLRYVENENAKKQDVKKESPEKRCVVTSKTKDRFWVDLSSKNRGKTGLVQLSMELLPKEIAERLPAGFGRDEPNANPFLPPPEGRAKFSLFNPCMALRNLLGDRLCFKLGIICLWTACIAFIVFITPNLVSAIAADLIVGQ